MNATEVLAFLKSRRSVRRYSDRPISRQEIERVIEAACWAPSNHNRQGWKFIVFENRDEIRHLSKLIRDSLQAVIKAAGRPAPAQAHELLYYAGAFDDAPVVILVIHKKSPAMGKELLASAVSDLASGEALSAAMAVQNLLLAAHALDLATCVMTAPLLVADPWLNLPDLPVGFLPTCLVTMGHPLEVPEMPPRKNIKHVIEYR